MSSLDLILVYIFWLVISPGMAMDMLRKMISALCLSYTELQIMSGKWQILSEPHKMNGLLLNRDSNR